MVYSYTEVQMKSALNLLNQIEVKGIENCKRIAMIEGIIQSPQKEDNDGNDSKEE